jgi:OOP family OmpA-OmpF porin
MRKQPNAVRWSYAAALLSTLLIPASPALAQIGYVTGGIDLAEGGTTCIRSGSWEPALAIVPCEPDADGDGVPDLIDECPNTPAGWTVDAKGCPLDSDGDGVPDSIDKCPGTAAGAQVGQDGCPLDTDGDGVPDYLDKCPGTPRGTTVDSTGCPVDSDGDGVLDHLDLCPDTPAGVRVNQDGCEVKGKITVPTALFDFARSEITNASAQELGVQAGRLAKIVAQIQSVTVIGHTDSVGSDAFNDELSLRRARSVRDFLVGRGIPADLIQVSGEGKRQPIASNDTAEGRARNRRVEITTKFKDE